MTTEVLFVRPKDSMDKVQDIFRMNNIHHLSVLEEIDDKVVGIISKSDYFKLQSTFPLFKQEKSDTYNDAVFHTLLVKDVMTKQIAMLNPEDSLTLAASYFAENLFHAIPVVDKNKNLVGILSTFDMLNFAFHELLLLGE